MHNIIFKIHQWFDNLSQVSLVSISVSDSHTILIALNWFALLILLLFFCLLFWLFHKLGKGRIEVSEANLGIGDNSVTLKFNRKDQEIAYKLWVELATRMIGIEFSEDNVISEVYDSWYACFGITRDLLKEIPIDQLRANPKLYSIMIDILNKCLRPHLTQWQAEFRTWYSYQRQSNPSTPPQVLQKQFPFYNTLVADIKKTNRKIQQYINALEHIAFGNNGMHQL